MTLQPHPSALPYDSTATKPFGPSALEHRTAQAGFSELGIYFQTFAEQGWCDPWTLRYEETVFVIKGEASIKVIFEDGESEITGQPGDLIALPKGVTVRYGANAGTELLLSMAPVNWRQIEAAKGPHTTPRVLFLTPFNFAQPEHDDQFDHLVAQLIGSEAGFVAVADHVARFDPGDDYDKTQTAAVLDAVAKAEADGFDAVVMACFYDPAVDAARAATDLPVIAPLQMVTTLAAQHGDKFAVITDIAEAEMVIGDLIRDYGLGEGSLGVHAVGLDMDDIVGDTFAAAKAVDDMLVRLAEHGEAQSVVIACTIVGAAYETHREQFPDRGIPVLNGNLLCANAAAQLANRERSR